MKKKQNRLILGAGIGLVLLWWLSQNKKTSTLTVKPSPTAMPDTVTATPDMLAGYRYHSAV